MSEMCEFIRARSFISECVRSLDPDTPEDAPVPYLQYEKVVVEASRMSNTAQEIYHLLKSKDKALEEAQHVFDHMRDDGDNLYRELRSLLEPEVGWDLGNRKDALLRAVRRLVARSRSVEDQREARSLVVST